MTRLLCLLFYGSFVLVSICWCFVFKPTHFSWNVCLLGNNNQLLISQTLKTCVKQCDQMKSCASVNFDHYSRRCTLHIGPQDAVMCYRKGIVLFEKKDWKEGLVTEEKITQYKQRSEGCEALSSPANGYVVGNLLETGARVSYRCDPCYDLDTTSGYGRMCLGNNSWSEKEIECVLGNALIDIGQTTGIKVVVLRAEAVYQTVDRISFNIARDLDNIAMHMLLRFDLKHTMFNTKRNGEWKKDKVYNLPFSRSRLILLSITCMQDRFIIDVCGRNVQFVFPRRQHYYKADDKYFYHVDAKVDSLTWSLP